MAAGDGVRARRAPRRQPARRRPRRGFSAAASTSCLRIRPPTPVPETAAQVDAPLGGQPPDQRRDVRAGAVAGSGGWRRRGHLRGRSGASAARRAARRWRRSRRPAAGGGRRGRRAPGLGGGCGLRGGLPPALLLRGSARRGRGGRCRARRRRCRSPPAPRRRRRSRPRRPRSRAGCPLTGAGISVSTLSVDTSSSGSSAVTSSPTAFSQRVTVPSVTLSPSAGMVTDVPSPPPRPTEPPDDGAGCLLLRRRLLLSGLRLGLGLRRGGCLGGLLLPARRGGAVTAVAHHR